MIGNVLKKVFGSKNERELKRLARMVVHINAFEAESFRRCPMKH